MPGLAEELNRLEKSYKQIQQEKENRAAGAKSKLSSHNISERSNSVMAMGSAPVIDIKGKIVSIDDDIIIPKSRAEFDEVTAAMKNKN